MSTETRSRIEVRRLDDGTLDEVVLLDDKGRCLFHLEAMSDGHWWMSINVPGRGPQFGPKRVEPLAELHVNLATRHGAFIDALAEWTSGPYAIAAQPPKPKRRKS